VTYVLLGSQQSYRSVEDKHLPWWRNMTQVKVLGLDLKAFRNREQGMGYSCNLSDVHLNPEIESASKII
jgi:hypothetical protein